MLCRKSIKAEARHAMSGKKPNVHLVSLLFLVIILVLEYMSIWVQTGMAPFEYYFKVFQGETPPTQSNLVVLLLIYAIAAMNGVLRAGYTYYALRISRNEQAGFGELFDCFSIFFKVLWLNIVTGFFICMWTLLFIIPGFVAAFRYSMAIYILLDDPELPVMECIRRSKEMTMGYKWELFVLDMSFLGWSVLACCVPLLYIFVWPYIYITNAKYYNILSGWVPGEPVITENSEQSPPWEL